MCWFITVAVTADAAKLLPQPARAPELRAVVQENRSIARALATVERLPKQLGLWSLTHNGCSCDLVRAMKPGYALRDDVRGLFATIAEQTRQPLALVVHTYRGPLDEAFDVAKGPRLTPDELRAKDGSIPADAICVVREIPRFD